MNPPGECGGLVAKVTLVHLLVALYFFVTIRLVACDHHLDGVIYYRTQLRRYGASRSGYEKTAIYPNQSGKVMPRCRKLRMPANPRINVGHARTCFTYTAFITQTWRCFDFWAKAPWSNRNPRPPGVSNWWPHGPHSPRPACVKGIPNMSAEPLCTKWIYPKRKREMRT